MKIDQNIKDVVSEIGYTLSYLVGVACIISLFFTTGCAASASADAKSGANVDWSAAYKDGVCHKSAGQEAYVACLEKSQEIGKEFPPPAAASTEPAPKTVLVQRTEETKVVTPPQAPPPSLIPEGTFKDPKSIQFGSGGFIFVPQATGASCDLPKKFRKFQFMVHNSTEDLLEVRGRLVPLNCEVGDKFVPARVLRNGRIEETWVLKAGHTGRLVFLPFDGGLGSAVSVEIRSLMDMGSNAPALPHGSVRSSFQVPSPKGGFWEWEVTPTMLK